ncbi:MAG: RNA polymerase sigma factor [Bacteroidetes bacterium]|nr:MAG: RNA polymerase sigma factor [Bacteroidota bacterium]
MIFLKNKTGSVKDFSDEDLVAAILKSKDRAQQRSLQEELYVRYADKVFQKCKTIVKDTETAKDLTHDILVKIFLKLGSFRGTSPFHFWVLAIAYNHCISYLNKEKRLPKTDFDHHAHQFSTEADDDLEQKLLTEVRLEQLEQAFEYLKEDERLVLLMRYQDGLSIKEIADYLNLGESAVKMRLKRTRDRLAQIIQENESKS